MREDIEPIRRILAGNIKKYRKNFGYSQEKLAEKSHLSAQTLNDIEGCRRRISAATLTKLAKTLHVAEYQLLMPENEEVMQRITQHHKLRAYRQESYQFPKKVIPDILAFRMVRFLS